MFDCMKQQLTASPHPHPNYTADCIKLAWWQTENASAIKTNVVLVSMQVSCLLFSVCMACNQLYRSIYHLLLAPGGEFFYIKIVEAFEG